MHSLRKSCLSLVGLVLVISLAQGQTGTAYLGITVDAVSGGGLPKGQVVVREVAPGGPAAKAGLKAGDVITKAGATEVHDFESFADLIKKHAPGDKLALTITRAGKEETLTATLGEKTNRTDHWLRPGFLPPEFEPPGDRRGALLGVQSQELTAELKNRLGVSVEKGAVVTEVAPGTAAAKAGLKPSDVITAVDGKPIANHDDLRAAIQKTGAGKEVVLRVARGKETLEIKAKLEEGVLPIPQFQLPRLPGPGGRIEFPPMMEDARKMQELERKIQELERRVRELEQRVPGAKPPELEKKPSRPPA